MSYRLTQITINLSPTARRLVIFVPPLLIGSVYILRKLYLLLKSDEKSIRENGKIQYEDITDSPASFSTTTSMTFNQVANLKDNLDGCAFSSDHKIGRSALSSSHKCANCRGGQKLSFRETSVYETSLKKFSTGQLVKYGFENLNNAIKALEELKEKTNSLKEYSSVDEDNNVDSKLETLFNNLNKLSLDFEIFRNEFMPATYSVTSYLPEEDDDFDDQASYLSSATTTSMGYWDPEPNLHFFEIYQEALKNVAEIKSPRTDRTIATGCDNYEDFLAKVSCLRSAFAQLFSRAEIRSRYTKIGEEILRVILDHTLRDSTRCINAYYAFLNFITNENNFETIEMELKDRNINSVSFYDIVLDYMIMESFDDLENPPSAVKSVVSNRWLSASFREISLQTAVSAVMRRKRSKLLTQDGFFAHFYTILDDLSPVMAWGFLGTDDNLKFKCYSIKESTTAVINDYFSFDRCRYTSFDDLCEDILRVTEERYWELNNKLSILN
ncbi:Mitoguardin [Blomia tropicalis]|nr:Mitoguardin [Blomia tropicalis]